MNRIMQWWRGPPRPAQPDPADIKFAQAMRLTDEVRSKIRGLLKVPHPFRMTLAELLLQPQKVDVALVADAYEMLQEARIFYGPPNGRG